MTKRSFFSFILALFFMTGAFGSCSFAAEKTSPQDDFYEYINSQQLEEWEIPADSPYISWIYEIYETVDQRMEDIITDLVQTPINFPEGDPEQMIADLYRTAVDWETRNATEFGDTVSQMIEDIENAPDLYSYVEVISNIYYAYGICPLFCFDYTIDQADSSKFILDFHVHSTNLEDVWKSDDVSSEKVKNAYLDHIKNLFIRYGFDARKAQKRTDMCHEIITLLSNASLNQQDLYDPEITYNVYHWDAFFTFMSNLDRESIQKIYQIENEPTIVISQEHLAKILNDYLTPDNLEKLKAYAQYVILDQVACYTSRDNMEQSLKISAIIAGQEEPTEIDRAILDLISHDLKYACGKLYVHRYFPEESKRDVEEMIDMLIDEYKQLIQSSDWLSASSKEYAIQKLDHMIVAVGYPTDEKWLDVYNYAEIIPPSDGGIYIENILSLYQSERKFLIDLYQKPVDKEIFLWMDPPQTVNAFNSLNFNAIIFPAGILQEPFYSPDATLAQNLGGIGAVIGHEISHSFDNNGALYDINGNYLNWWREEDYAAFETRVQKVAAYYHNYPIIDGYFVDGDLTVSENIADLASLECITSILEGNNDALREAYEQWATIWAGKYTDAYLINIARFDVHSPAKVRVNAVLSSMDKFYELYPIEIGDDMYVAPEDRPQIW